jgi:hypothetical protein
MLPDKAFKRLKDELDDYLLWRVSSFLLDQAKNSCNSFDWHYWDIIMIFGLPA